MKFFNFFKRHHLENDGLTIKLEYRVLGQKVFGLELRGMDLEDLFNKLVSMITRSDKKNENDATNNTPKNDKKT